MILVARFEDEKPVPSVVKAGNRFRETCRCLLFALEIHGTFGTFGSDPSLAQVECCDNHGDS